MSTSLILSPDEIKEITGLVAKSAQIRQLSRMGIEHQKNSTGHPNEILNDLVSDSSISTETGKGHNLLTGLSPHPYIWYL